MVEVIESFDFSESPLGGTDSMYIKPLNLARSASLLCRCTAAVQGCRTWHSVPTRRPPGLTSLKRTKNKNENALQ